MQQKRKMLLIHLFGYQNFGQLPAPSRQLPVANRQPPAIFPALIFSPYPSSP